jgi:hypothetical protein
LVQPFLSPSGGYAFFQRKRLHFNSHSTEDEEIRRDPLAIVLCFCVTASFVVQLPGVSGYLGFGSVPTAVPQDASGRAHFALTWFLVVIPGFAGAYSLLRPLFLRVPLIAAGTLIILLWLLSAPLHDALEAVS